VFENRETVKILDEIEVYNTLLPGPGELAATMTIEIREAAEIKPVLDKLLGIDTWDSVLSRWGPT
jgi:hypothetical protein